MVMLPKKTISILYPGCTDPYVLTKIQNLHFGSKKSFTIDFLKERFSELTALFSLIFDVLKRSELVFYSYVDKKAISIFHQDVPEPYVLTKIQTLHFGSKKRFTTDFLRNGSPSSLHYFQNVFMF